MGPGPFRNLAIFNLRFIGKYLKKAWSQSLNLRSNKTTEEKLVLSIWIKLVLLRQMHPANLFEKDCLFEKDHFLFLEQYTKDRCTSEMQFALKISVWSF